MSFSEDFVMSAAQHDERTRKSKRPKPYTKDGMT